jgi:hypothetical protein
MIYLLNDFLSLRKLFSPLAIGVALLLTGVASTAATVEGTLNGLHCAKEGIVCPVEDMDVIIAFESDFVIMQPDGTYFFVPNIDRAIKAKYMLETVKVIGKKHVMGKKSPSYFSIIADEFQVKQDDGSYKTTWSTEMKRRVYNDLKLPGSSRP